MAKNLLLCHIMDSTLMKEVGIVKSKTYAQEFKWRKRMWPISKDAIWSDRKGVNHLHVDVNESDGTIRFLTPEKINLYSDKLNNKGEYELLNTCGECGNRISIDARNTYDLLKRKTINAIWGIDNSYVMLLLIMGMVLVMLVGALFYVIGELNKTNVTLQQYLPSPTAKLLIGVNIINAVV